MTPIEALDKCGWLKGSLTNDAGNLCLIGARNYAVNGNAKNADDKDFHSWTVRAGKIADELFPGRTDTQKIQYPAAQFNDHPDTTLEDVKLVLKHAEVE